MGLAVGQAKETKRSRRKQRTVVVAAGRTGPQERRYRQKVKKVDLWSVLKLSLCFYFCALVVTILAGVVLWLVASGFGVIENVEDFMRELLSSEDFEFLSSTILEGAALIGLVLVALMTIITVLAAALYNLFSEMVGGLEVTVVEDEDAHAV
ncbi:MAG: DUF3566 domain-containing protein [Acidimicrobiia bacterium]|nr:DUF3566 domain-containing protein [Acidimicrobiia bacterium]